MHEPAQYSCPGGQQLPLLHQSVGAHAVGVVLVTHGHADHLELAERFAGLHQARVARYPELADGDIVRVGALDLTAYHFQAAPPGLIFTNHANLFDPRLTLYLDAQAGPALSSRNCARTAALDR